jgi:carbon monoxide dehydrogenase subunit G
MALTLENEFVVAAPVEPTWRLLLDLERVAGCLPGASVEPAEAEGTLLGKMRVKLGPVTMDYRGTAWLEEVDQEAHTAVVAVEGKETRGQGSASAKIRNSLSDEDGATRVRVETQLSVTGRPAQFGRGIMQDVAAKMLGDFATCLSKRLAEAEPAPEEQPAAPAATPQPEPGTVPPAPAPALDLTPAVRGVIGSRVLKAAGLVALAGFFSRLVRRRRRRRR